MIELEPPSVTYHARESTWELLEDHSYFDQRHHAELHVQAGFRFDLASVPRILWAGIAPYELSIIGPLYHDALSKAGGDPRRLDALRITPARIYTRGEADIIFLDLMVIEGVSKWRRWSAYATVRAAGWTAWRG